MNDLTTAVLHGLVRAHVAVTAPHERDERGDVPGWVMITVMTAGLVAIIWTAAEDQLGSLLERALSSVGVRG